MHRRTPLLLAVALLLPLTARAEESPDDAQAAMVAALAKLPAPSAEHAFTFEGDAIMNGTPFGSVTFKAEPTSEGEAWSVSDRFSFGGGAFVRTSTATLDRRLQPLSGHVESKEPGTDGFEVEWTRTDTGLSMKHTATKAGETTSARKELAQAGTFTTTMCSLWLFARLTGVTRGSYAVQVFEADPSEGDATFELATWTQGEKGTRGDREVLLLKGSKGDDLMEAAFDPETGALLGARTKNEAKGVELEIRPVAPEPTEEEVDDLFSRPARSAEEAAMQGGLALATGDLALFERVAHWPTLHADAQARHTGETPFPDLETFRTDLLAGMKESLPSMPRPMMEGVVKMSKSQLRTEAIEGGLTQVTFPPMFRNLVLVVGEFDGRWLLARAPGRPR